MVTTRMPESWLNFHTSGSLTAPRMPIWMVRLGSSRPSSTARRKGAPWWNLDPR